MLVHLSNYVCNDNITSMILRHYCTCAYQYKSQSEMSNAQLDFPCMTFTAPQRH